MAAVQTQPTASELEMRGSSWEVNYDGKWCPAEVAGTYTIEKENYIVLLFSGKQVATHTVSDLLAGHKVRRPPVVLEFSDPELIRRTMMSEQRRTRERSSVIIQSLARRVAARRCARHLRAERARRRPGPPSLLLSLELLASLAALVDHGPSYQSHLETPLYHEEAVKLLQSAAYYIDIATRLLGDKPHPLSVLLSPGQQRGVRSFGVESQLRQGLLAEPGADAGTDLTLTALASLGQSFGSVCAPFFRDAIDASADFSSERMDLPPNARPRESLDLDAARVDVYGTRALAAPLAFMHALTTPRSFVASAHSDRARHEMPFLLRLLGAVYNPFAPAEPFVSEIMNTIRPFVSKSTNAKLRNCSTTIFRSYDSDASRVYDEARDASGAYSTALDQSRNESGIVANAIMSDNYGSRFGTVRVETVTKAIRQLHRNNKRWKACQLAALAVRGDGCDPRAYIPMELTGLECPDDFFPSSKATEFMMYMKLSYQSESSCLPVCEQGTRAGRRESDRRRLTSSASPLAISAYDMDGQRDTHFWGGGGGGGDDGGASVWVREHIVQAAAAVNSLMAL